VLAGLPQRQLLSGFAEIIKHGLIADKAYFERVTAKPPRAFTPDELADIIAGSCRIKAAIVQSDETERGERKLLNFGHTVGHAVEALSLATARPLLHGEAISVGLLAEATISERLGMIDAAASQQIKQALQQAELPTTYEADVDEVLKKMRSDKKTEAGQLNFTLLSGIGQALYNQPVTELIVIEALQTVLRPSQ